MQITDMRAFRALRPHSNHFRLRTRNPLLPPSLPSPGLRRKEPQFLTHFRLFHSLKPLSSRESTAFSSTSITNPISDQPPAAWSYRAAGANWGADEEDEDARPQVSSSNHGASRNADLGHVLFNNNNSGKKKGKGRIEWVCSNCGNTYGQWWGTCSACKHVGTIKQFSVASEDVDVERSRANTSGFALSENAMMGAWLPAAGSQSPTRPVRLRDVSRSINETQWRIPLAGLFGAELSRVLGGGVVPGSLILVGGDPGVGKSTLSLQIAAIIAEGAATAAEQGSVLYVSGEESIEQIGNRADRMRIGTEDLFLYSSTDIEDILKTVKNLPIRALIVDSIQTVYLKGVTGSPGGIQQVKECTSALLRFAKTTNIPVLLIGHVNKSGEIAGPRVLEHIVDVVLYLEGEKHSSYRLLRSVKNRFGSTDELGVFEMCQSGLQAVANPSEIFLTEQHSDSEHLAGLAVAVTIDGSRTFLIEVQALCIAGSSKHVNGVPSSRADMIISVLMKQAGLKLEGHAVYLNVVSGVSLSETAGDLAIAAAICSSFLEFPIPNNVAFIGEVGLAGELRMVPRIDKRVNTLAKLGYKLCVVPKSAEASLNSLGFTDMRIVGCKNIREVIEKVFSNL